MCSSVEYQLGGLLATTNRPSDCYNDNPPKHFVQGTFVQGEKLLLNHFLDAQAFLAPTPVSPSVGYTECSNLVRGLDDKEVDKVDDEVADMVVP